MEPPRDEKLLYKIGAPKDLNSYSVYNKNGKNPLGGHQNLFEKLRREQEMHFQNREQSTYPVQLMILESNTQNSISFLDDTYETGKIFACI